MNKHTNDLIVAELQRARAKFPGTKHLLAALHEESGELAKAFLDYDTGKGTKAELVAEAVQVAAMAIRCLEEGDADFTYTPDPEHARK